MEAALGPFLHERKGAAPKKEMKNIKACAFMCALLLVLNGCAASGTNGSEAGKAAAQAGSQAASTAPEGKNQVQAKLDQTGMKLASMANRTVAPNKKKPTVTKRGKEYVASYVEVDLQSVRTTMRPGQSSRVPYVGIIEYMENGYECRGTTRAAAKSLKDCKPTKSRRVQELISYDGKKWQY